MLAGDWGAAEDDARWALELGAGGAESPIGRYAATLAHLVLGDGVRGARSLADALRTHEGFPRDVADALAYVAAEDVVGYVEAVESVLRSFETRDEYLEDMPVADTVLVLQALAASARPAGGGAQLVASSVPGSAVICVSPRGGEERDQ